MSRSVGSSPSGRAADGALLAVRDALSVTASRPCRSPAPSSGTVNHAARRALTEDVDADADRRCLVDGEHYPPVTWWAIDGRARAGPRCGARAARRRDREGAARRAARPRRAAPRRRVRRRRRAGDGARRVCARRWCSTCPTSRCSATASGWSSPLWRSRAASRTSVRTSGWTRRSRTLPRRGPHDGGDRDGQADGQDGDRGGGRTHGRPAAGLDPVVVAMGRGGPSEPQVVEAGTVSLEHLLDLVRDRAITPRPTTSRTP